LANVGDKPIIWIVHSFGGVIVKEMLRFSSKHESFRSLLDNSMGIVFFSTPHRGSEIASQTDTLALHSLLRASSVVELLNPENLKLTQLHQQFGKIAGHISTLSFGENNKFCIGQVSKFTCLQVVSDESSNPKFERNQQLQTSHKWIKLDANHRETCKPKEKTSRQYVEVISFIRQLLESRKTMRQK
jgi:hypothetical protein